MDSPVFRAVLAVRRRSPWALGLGGSLALATSAALLFSSLRQADAAGVTMPAPATRAQPRTRTLDGVGKVDAAFCTTSCHQDVGAEWRGSLHQQAWKDPIFLKAYELEPVAFCRGCHAPEGNPEDVLPSLRAQDAGVSCTTCHVEAGRVQGAHPQVGAPHPFRLAPGLGGEGACVTCHQFDFPKQARQTSPSPMQDTVAEWRASSFASTSCQDCHMPLVGEGDKRHRSHDFRVIGDPNILKEALIVSATRPSDERVVLSLASGKVGHAFPTGDMFRRLEVRAFAIDGSGRVLASAKPVELARTFRDVPRDPDSKTDLSHQRIEVSDTRLGPPGTKNAERTVALTLPAAAAKGARVRWEVAYQRMMHPLAESFGVNPLEDETLLASGVIDAIRPPPPAPR